MVLSVSACDGPVQAAVTHKDEPDGARFVCKESVSGHCYVFVYTEECARPYQNPDARVVSCTAKVHKRFSLAAGATTTIAGLPSGHVVCVKAQPETGFPSCIFAPPWIRQMERGSETQSEMHGEVAVER